MGSLAVEPSLWPLPPSSTRGATEGSQVSSALWTGWQTSSFDSRVGSDTILTQQIHCEGIAASELTGDFA